MAINNRAGRRIDFASPTVEVGRLLGQLARLWRRRCGVLIRGRRDQTLLFLASYTTLVIPPSDGLCDNRAFYRPAIAS